MITIRELTKKCGIHGTPLASRPVDGTKGQLVGRLMWCPICDLLLRVIVSPYQALALYALLVWVLAVPCLDALELR